MKSVNKFAIYTACIGGYDNILQPEVIDERFDYFLFTNDVKEESVGVWQVRKVAYSNPDMTRIARYVKTHPEELLPEYEATLWMDANIQIVSSEIYERFIDLLHTDVDVASICHPYRVCIYDEAFEVSYSKKYGRLEHDLIAINWCHHIYNEHYPIHNGLFETNILFRKNKELVNKANDLWWKSIDIYSKRDQLSCNYVLWKYNLAIDYFLPKGEHAQSSDKVRYISHGKISRRKLVQADFGEQWRYKTANLSSWTLKVWQKAWQKAYISNHPISNLKLYGVLLGVICSPFLLFRVIKHRLIKLVNR